MLLSSYRNNNENSSYYIEFRVLNGFTYVKHAGHLGGTKYYQKLVL